jgi:hypothetical protein
MDARHLPAGWSSTANALESVLSTAKDTVLVVDDFCPTGSQTDVQRMNRVVDHVFRGLGNATGRARLRSDSSFREGRAPRALILSTGEDIPRGQSLRARMLILEVERHDINWDRISECQADASTGRYATATAGFIYGLTSQLDLIHQLVNKVILDIRSILVGTYPHMRTAGIVANLMAAFALILMYAQQLGVITEAEGSELYDRCWNAMCAVAAKQSRHQATSDPVTRFIQLISSVISSGQGHLASRDGKHPERAGAWGWRWLNDEWRPQGQRIGWIDGNDVYLDSNAAVAEAQNLARGSGDSIMIDGATLNRRLYERGVLKSTDIDKSRKTVTVRRMIEDRRREVLHLDVIQFAPEAEEDDLFDDEHVIADPASKWVWSDD